MGEGRDMSTAPRDGSKFWGLVGEDAIAMFWHEGFGEFVSSFRRMTMAPGYLVNGKPYEDHSPVIHKPRAWLPMPAPTPAEGGA
jgi:hypothetical protein